MKIEIWVYTVQYGLEMPELGNYWEKKRERAREREKRKRSKLVMFQGYQEVNMESLWRRI